MRGFSNDSTRHKAKLLLTNYFIKDRGYSLRQYLSKDLVIAVKHGQRAIVSNFSGVTFLIRDLNCALLSRGRKLVVEVGLGKNIRQGRGNHIFKCHIKFSSKQVRAGCLAFRHGANGNANLRDLNLLINLPLGFGGDGARAEFRKEGFRVNRRFRSEKV